MINILTTYSNLYKVTKILSKSAIIKELSIEEDDYLFITVMIGKKSYKDSEYKYILTNARNNKHRVIKRSWWQSYVRFLDSPKQLYTKPVIELEHTNLPYSHFENNDMLDKQTIF